MRILLLAMPDTASSLDRVMKFPNLGLCSLAAEAPEHEVRVLDLVLRPRGVRRRVLDEVAAFQPDLVGYSAMSFQYETARILAESVRAAAPGTLHVLGGYHATVLADQIAARDGRVFDFIVRGEGGRGVFFVDDNITIDVPRFKELCEEIAAAGLSHLRYIVQASVHGIAKDPALAPAMARAGFDTVFMGIENAEDANVAALDIRPKLGRGENETPRAVRLLQENGIKAVGGFIVGNPDDDRAAIRRTFRYARRLGLDFPIVQCLTPYPRTEMRAELLAEGLVTHPDDLTRYNGYMVNVRTRHLGSAQVARAMLWESLKLYYDPRAARRSRFFRDFPAFRGRMLLNNLALFAGARNRLFHSTHTV